MDVPDVNAPPSLAEKIEAVLAALETQGLEIDIEQRVRLETFLLRLAADGRLPDSADDVSNLLTPILAGTSAQQAMCRSIFKTVFLTDRETPKSDPVKPQLDRDNVNDRMRWLRPAILAKGLAAGAAVFVGASVLLAVPVLFAPIQSIIEQNPKSTSSLAMPSSRIQLIEKYPIDEFDPPHQRPWNRSLRWYYTEYAAEKWLAILLPWVVI